MFYVTVAETITLI